MSCKYGPPLTPSSKAYLYPQSSKSISCLSKVNDTDAVATLTPLK